MPAKDLGTKHTCYKCGTKFYDLRKPEPLCPKCGADQRQSPALRPAERRKPAPKPAPVPVEAPEVDAELDDDAPLDDDEDEAADDDDEG